MPLDPMTNMVVRNDLSQKAHSETVKQSVENAVNAKTLAGRFTSRSKDEIISDVFKKQDWNYAPTWYNIFGRILKYFRLKEVSQLTKEVLSQQKKTLLPAVAAKVKELAKANASFQSIREGLAHDSRFNVFKPQELALLSHLNQIDEAQVPQNVLGKDWKTAKRNIRGLSINEKLAGEALATVFNMSKKELTEVQKFYSGESDKAPSDDVKAKLPLAYLVLKAHPELLPKSHRGLLKTLDTSGNFHGALRQHFLNSRDKMKNEMAKAQKERPLDEQQNVLKPNPLEEVAKLNLSKNDNYKVQFNDTRPIQHSNTNEINEVLESIPERDASRSSQDNERNEMLQSMIWLDYRPTIAELAGTLTTIDPSMSLTDDSMRTHVTRDENDNYQVKYTYKANLTVDDVVVGTVELDFSRSLNWNENSKKWEAVAGAEPTPRFTFNQK
ncbi:MAG: hypothetical protein JSS32_00570 [Verrucomicrobia bacterium]|nr:hypothetical protein [Verrucomicrobiota bacterium]